MANDEQTTRLRTWYQGQVRPFLQGMNDPRVDELDRDLQRLLQRAQKLKKPLAACFIGGSGVGKSTLINCLVGQSEIIVPSGGVGPLTAQATRIEFSATRALQAIYHAPATVWKTIFALEMMFHKELNLPEFNGDPDLAVALDPSDVHDLQELTESDDHEKRKRAEQYRKQALLLVKGQQHRQSDIGYLIDSLRESIGKERKWGTTPNPDDAARMRRLQYIFNTTELKTPSCYECVDTDDGFAQQLHDHASGFLAPAIKNLEIGWNSPLLANGLQLVDLPGVGIAGDLYRTVTDEWMRSRAHAVVLVVDNRGIRESDAELLRSSGFLNRLLHSLDDPSGDPVALLVAVVKADEIADERRAQDKTKRKRQHLADVMQLCAEVVLSQIRDRLVEAWSLTGKLSDSKQTVVDRLISTLSIYPVSAIQYRKLYSSDEDDPAFIDDPKESGVPQLVEGLSSLAQRYRHDAETHFQESLNLYRERLTSSLELIRARAQVDAHGRHETDEIEKHLALFLEPLQKDFHARQGAYRAFLKEVVPSQIDTVVTKSQQNSARDISLYLKTLQKVHWATLRAAVRRGGAFDGSRTIDLPRDFAQTFEEPIAEMWSETILKQLRLRTKEFADDCINVVDKIVSWTQETDLPVQPKLIEAQRDSIASDAKQLTTIGREKVNELRDLVKEGLAAAIEPPIRTKCQSFVRSNADSGSGVKNRILELFDQLARDAIEAATTPAKTVLLQNYRAVEQEIREVFQDHQNPIAAAASAIVASHEETVRRSDTERRVQILAQVDAVLGGLSKSDALRSAKSV